MVTSLRTNTGTGLQNTKKFEMHAGLDKALEAHRNNRRRDSMRLFGNWNATNAYVFGVLWADGHTSPSQISLVIQVRDRVWHRKIGKWFDPNILISELDVKAFGKIHRAVHWAYGNKFLIEHLHELGIVRRKSFVDPVYKEVPDEFLGHFARGVFDGDGTREQDGNPRWYGSRRFLHGFSAQVNRCWGLSEPTIKPCKPGGRVHYLRWKLVHRDRINHEMTGSDPKLVLTRKHL